MSQTIGCFGALDGVLPARPHAVIAGSAPLSQTGQFGHAPRLQHTLLDSNNSLVTLWAQGTEQKQHVRVSDTQTTQTDRAWS